MRVAICGGSNTGKTTLFNLLTNSQQKTGNWHGVTTESFAKKVKILNKEIEFVDLAGLESIKTYSIEENNTLNFLKTKQYDLIINVIEATNFINGFNLLKELSLFNKPIIVFVNFADELKKNGGFLHVEKLRKLLNNQLVYGEVIKGEFIDQLINLLFSKNLKNLNLKNENSKSFFVPPKIKLNFVDRMFLNGKTAFLLFSLCLGLSFYLAFGRYGLGVFLNDKISVLGDFLQTITEIWFIKLKVNKFISGLIVFGIIGGVFSVLSFIPQIIILNLCLIVLEQTGIIARISFLTDNFLGKIGVNGKAVFALLSGFGCTVVASKICNGLENKEIKNRVISTLPFVCCSAKVPVIIYFSSIIFKNYTFLVLLCVYLISVLFSFLYLFILSKVVKNKSMPMILQVPYLRKINLFNTFKPLILSLKEFIIKILTVVLLSSVGCYILSTVSVDFKFLNEGELSNSILAFFSKKLCFIFAPIKLDRWEIVASLINGIFAKESIISSLYLLMPNGLNLSLASGLSLMVFVLFYTPCLVAIDSFRVEVGIKKATFLALFQFLVALCLAYLTYFIIIII